MEHTIFEKIVAREIPADIVYEDDRVLAFLDIKPVNQGHTLVIPKKKFVNIFDADEAVLGHMMEIAGRIGQALREATQCEGVNIVMNNEPVAGQVIFHAHIHVIPRHTNDGVAFHPPHQEFDEARGKEIMNILKASLTQ